MRTLTQQGSCNQEETLFLEIQSIVKRLNLQNYSLMLDNEQEDGYKFEINQHAIYFKGINLINNEEIQITISKTNQLSYGLLKQESQIQKLLKYFDSTVKYIDEIDIPEERLFILITENIEKSLQQILDEREKENKIYSIRELVNISYQLIFQLFEIHCKGITHYNINPDSIVQTKSGLFKFRDFIPLQSIIEVNKHIIQDIQENQDESQNYLAPEVLKVLDQQMNQENLEINQFSDVYSLGMVLLKLIGLEFNQKSLKLIKEERFLDLQSEINPEYNNLYVFIYSYMLNQNQYLRIQSIGLLRVLYRFYNDIFISPVEAIENINRIIKKYEDNNLEADYYLAFLYTIQINFDNKLIDCEKLDTVLNQLRIKNEEEYNNNHLLIGSVGSSYLRLHKYKQSFEIFSQTLQKIKLLNKQSSFEADWLNQIGNALFYLESYEKALKYFENVLEIREQIYPKGHLCQSDILRNIALCYGCLNNYEKSLQFSLRAYEIREKILTGDHYFIAESLLSLGDSYSLVKNHEASLDYQIKALEMKQRLYSGAHIQIVDSFNNLAIYYYDLRQYDKALGYFQKDLNMSYELYDKQDLEIATSLRNIGLCQYYLGNYESAIDYDKQSLQIRKNYQLENDSQSGHLLLHIANSYNMLNDRDNEIVYRYEHFCQQVHLNQLKTYNHNKLLYVLNDIFSYDSRIKLIKQIIRIIIKTPHVQLNFIRDIFYLIIDIFEQIGDYEEVEYYQILEQNAIYHKMQMLNDAQRMVIFEELNDEEEEEDQEEEDGFIVEEVQEE